jgi:hypothetical protein
MFSYIGLVEFFTECFSWSGILNCLFYLLVWPKHCNRKQKATVDFYVPFDEEFWFHIPPSCFLAVSGLSLFSSILSDELALCKPETVLNAVKITKQVHNRGVHVWLLHTTQPWNPLRGRGCEVSKLKQR